MTYKYEVGDIVEAKVAQIISKEFIVVYVDKTNPTTHRNRFLLSALSGSSMGKYAYPTNESQIKGLIRKEPNHPWIWSSLKDGKTPRDRKNKKQKQTSQPEDEVILVERREGNWYAGLEDFDDCFALGKTPSEAVGNLIIVHGKLLGFKIQKK